MLDFQKHVAKTQKHNMMYTKQLKHYKPATEIDPHKPYKTICKIKFI